MLRKRMAPFLRDHTSSRCLCVGPNTDLAMNREISDEEQRQALGHSRGTPTKLYVHMNRDMGVPVSLALALLNDVRKVVSPPTMDAIDLSTDDVELLIDKLYIISLKVYKKGEKMRPLLHHGTASLIMYHPSYVEQYNDQYKLPKKLIKSVIRLGWAADSNSASVKLNKWANQIKTRFITENNLLPKNATNATMVQTLNNQSVMMNRIIIDKEAEKSERTASILDIRDLKQEFKITKLDQRKENSIIRKQQDIIMKQQTLIISLLKQGSQVSPSSQRGVFNSATMASDELLVKTQLQ